MGLTPVKQSIFGSVGEAAGDRGGRLLLLAMLLLCALIAISGDAGRLSLRYERVLILDGEWWRLVTGHFVHLGWAHTVMNLLGLGILWLLFGNRYALVRWAGLLVLGLLIIDGGFLLFETRLSWYVGLSGILHTLLAAGALAWLRAGQAEGWILSGLVIAKLIWEQTIGAVPLSASVAGGAVVVDAHLYGAIAGWLGELFFWLNDRRALRL